MDRKQWLARIFFYLAGMMILALGLTLNTVTGLGVSPMLSISYAVSQIFGLNFGDITFLVYLVYVLIQLVIRGKQRNLLDFLQIPFNMVFTRLLNLFGDLLQIEIEGLLGNLLLLTAAIILTGVGAAMSVNARLVANPADGLILAISDITGRNMGLVKNLVDGVCVFITIAIGLLFSGRIVGVGVGTVCAVLLVGRVIWLYNRLFQEKVNWLCGMPNLVPAKVRAASMETEPEQ